MNANLLIRVINNGRAPAESAAIDIWLVEQPITDLDVRCLTADPRYPHLIYTKTQGQVVLQSQDTGNTWRPAGLVGGIVKSIAVSAFPGESSAELGWIDLVFGRLRRSFGGTAFQPGKHSFVIKYVDRFN